MRVETKIGMGTQNMAEGPAMSIEECVRAVKAGIELAHDAHKEGVDILGTGDMGIGNTTPSSVIFVSHLSVEKGHLLYLN